MTCIGDGAAGDVFMQLPNRELHVARVTEDSMSLFASALLGQGCMVLATCNPTRIQEGPDEKGEASKDEG